MSTNEMIGLAGGLTIAAATGLGLGLSWGIAMAGLVLVVFASRRAILDILSGL